MLESGRGTRPLAMAKERERGTRPPAMGKKGHTVLGQRSIGGRGVSHGRSQLHGYLDLS